MRILTAILLSGVCAFGESFINLPGETAQFAIATNEAVIFTCIRDAHIDTTWPEYDFGGLGKRVLWREGAILPGPAKVLTTNKCIVQFERFSAPHLRPLIWTNYWTNDIVYDVSVPADRTFRLLGNLDNSAEVLVRAARPGKTNFIDLLASPFVQPPRGAVEPLDLPGPIELKLSVPYCWDALRFYYFLEDAPELDLVVEKSLDLSTWSPVSVRSADPRAFYRLRISK